MRTVGEALASPTREIETAMGLLDARIVAGDGALGGELVERSLADWQSRSHRRLDQLAKLTAERHTDVPEVAFALEPDLKRAKGGSRDVVTLGIMNRLGLVPGPSPALRSAADTLLEVRVELQRAGGSSNVLFLDQQDPVAQQLGIDADELMERVSEAGRVVGWESDDAWRAVWSSRAPRRRDRERPGGARRRRARRRDPARGRRRRSTPSWCSGAPRPPPTRACRSRSRPCGSAATASRRSPSAGPTRSGTPSSRCSVAAGPRWSSSRRSTATAC